MTVKITDKGVSFSWEDDIPLQCRHCVGNKYVSALCYEAYKSRQLLAEKDRLIQGILDAIRDLSQANFTLLSKQIKEMER